MARWKPKPEPAKPEPFTMSEWASRWTLIVKATCPRVRFR